MKKWRINLVLILTFLISAIILTRLVQIQILNHEMWQALAQGQQIFFTTTKGERGEVFLQSKDGLIPLAVNKPSTFCFLSPNEIKNKEEVAEKVSKILNLDKEVILNKIRKENSFLPLKHNLSKEEIAVLKKLNLKGLYLEKEKLRNYPQQDLSSHIIGFLGGSNKGQYGIEGYYNDILEGKEGFVKGEKSPEGGLIFAEESKIKEGSDLILTIDYNIQFFAEKLLEKASKKLKIESGTIIVLDPNTGRILALANYPDFNPNSYSKEDLEVFKNNAIQSVFEPGSVFKPITMTAALNENKITPHTTYIDKGKVKIGSYTIENYNQRVFGKSTMTEVLEKSINTGAVFAERQLGHKNFLNYIKEFKFFEKTGIDLEGEVFSKNKEFLEGYEINFATAAFGQGIEMTAIQLARAFSALINGGKLITPYVVEKVLKNGKVIKKKPEVSKAIISSDTATKIKTMLISVVENGFGKRAQIPGYYIGGKTGTAQISWSALGIDKKGYSQKTWQTFIGFAPLDPKFLILIKLKNPQTRTAEYSAVPIFHDLAKYIVNYWEISPDYELAQ